MAEPPEGAREPARGLGGGAARGRGAGTLLAGPAHRAGAVAPSLDATETVLLWWGLFDQDLYVEHGDQRFGPYHPVGGPVPLHHYRRHKKGKREKRTDRVAALAGALQVPRAVLDGCPALAQLGAVTGTAPPRRPFIDPDPYREFAYTNRVTAKLAIAAALGMPLARLTDDERGFIDAVLAETLERRAVLSRVMARLRPGKEAQC